MTLTEEDMKKDKNVKRLDSDSVEKDGVLSSGEDNPLGEGQMHQLVLTRGGERLSLPWTVLYERKPFLYYNEIVKLGNEPFTFQSITDRRIYGHILLAENELRIRKRAELKYDKWWRKRGRELSEDAQEAYRNFWLDRAYIEALSRYVCDAFGFTGDKRLVVLRFMMHLYQRLKKESVSLWMAIAEEELKIWERKPNTDPKALRAAAHIVMKFMSARGNIRG
jgi:hypothetical protein